MDLTFRTATADDFAPLERMVIDSFEPITWAKKLEDRFGPPNGRDWRGRWHDRLQGVFQTQHILLAETEGTICAMASAAIERPAAMALMDVLAVGCEFQGRGYGREMLRAMMAHLKRLGCQYVHLDCLTDNDAGNALYESEGFVEVARHIHWFRAIE